MKRKISVFLAFCMLLGLFVGCSRDIKTSEENSLNQNGEESIAPSETDSPNPSESAGIETTDPNEEHRAEILAAADERRESILSSETDVTYTGTAYYVSNSGNDSSDGLSEETSWATAEKVSTASLRSGDAVFFRRGDSFAGQLYVKDGVTYSAYGTGAKPLLYGTSVLANDESDWSLMDGTRNIWVYKEETPDCGLILLNDGEETAARVTPWYIDGQFVSPAVHTHRFSVTKDLLKDLSFYSGTAMFSDEPTTGMDVRTDTGLLYLRCDKGNPAMAYENVRLLLWGNTIMTGSQEEYVVDNLAIKYCGGHGLYSGNNKVTVQNCEFGWIGGCIHYYYNGEEPVRFGNAIESDGNYDLYVVSNNYIHDVYDAGASNQCGGDMENITYGGNLIEYCNYGLEIFCNEQYCWDGTKSLFKNILVDDNIIMYSGYGWCQQRPDNTWNAAMECHDCDLPVFENVVVRNNIFYQGKNYLINDGAYKERPLFEGNTYVQEERIVLYRHDKKDTYDADSILEVDLSGTVYVMSADVVK